MKETVGVVGATWLQYGSFGALVLVLIAVGWYVNRMTDRQQERNMVTESWMKELVEQDREERQKRTDVLTELVKASVEAQQAMIGALNGLEEQTVELSEQASRYDTGAQERHREVLRRIEQRG
jgi:hypothetical protein